MSKRASPSGEVGGSKKKAARREMDIIGDKFDSCDGGTAGGDCDGKAVTTAGAVLPMSPTGVDTDTSCGSRDNHRGGEARKGPPSSLDCARGGDRKGEQRRGANKELEDEPVFNSQVLPHRPVEAVGEVGAGGVRFSSHGDVADFEALLADMFPRPSPHSPSPGSFESSGAVASNRNPFGGSPRETHCAAPADGCPPYHDHYYYGDTHRNDYEEGEQHYDCMGYAPEHEMPMAASELTSTTASDGLSFDSRRAEPSSPAPAPPVASGGAGSSHGPTCSNINMSPFMRELVDHVHLCVGQVRLQQEPILIQMLRRWGS
eukprot:GHVU01065667.1.p1 GENE.GHVU01065667.1~~GHVU01065667.1.p1  ORF type:complete len:317 (+),score=41.81 GHVU01065667.1:835-1785(+)